MRGALAFASAVTLLLLSGGGRAPDAERRTPTATPAPPRSLDIERGRKILSRHCGTCHTPGLPTTSEAALAIFSLADADWSSRMTPRQICASGRRITGTQRREPDEARAYAALVGRLLAERGAPPCGS